MMSDGMHESAIAKRLPADTVRKIFQYLKADEICRIGRVCKYWYRCASLQFFRKLVHDRACPTEPRDFGMGIGCLFEIPSYDWRLRLIARQHLLDAAAKTCSLSAKVAYIGMEMLRRGIDSKTIRHYSLEAARLFSEIFDFSHEHSNYVGISGAQFNTPEVSPWLLANLVSTGKDQLHDRSTQLLISKAIGILSLCEQNRKEGSPLGFVHYLVTIISKH